jgi:hypothetical protein
LNRAEFGAAVERERYRADVDRFVADWYAHIGAEETEVFPAAERLLDDADWQSIADELARERDPLHGLAGTELEFVIMVIAVSCVKLLSAHNSTQHTSRKHKV